MTAPIDGASGNDPTEHEIMRLLFAESAMFIAAIRNLKREDEDIALITHLLRMLHMATAPWVTQLQ